MTMHKALHPRNYIDYKLQEKKKEDSQAFGIVWVR